jgi:glycosyltransferase involved in cell wall biosynthesis
VIVPAHDEEGPLEHCLRHLLADAHDGEFDVVVVPNGCVDRTAEVARSWAERGVRCIEVSEPSKPAALRAGDDAARTFPRVYLDADVLVSSEAVRALATELRNGRWLAAAPRLTVDLKGVGRLAAAYLRVWAGLPVFDAGYVGSGCYALSEEGHHRVGAFPDLVNDDQFVNQLFTANEKVTLTHHRLTIRPPTTVRGIVRRSLRVRAGRLQQATSSHAEREPGGSATLLHVIRSATRSPRTAVDAALFLFVQVVIASLAQIRHIHGGDTVWLRDESSRAGVSAEVP